MQNILNELKHSEMSLNTFLQVKNVKNAFSNYSSLSCEEILKIYFFVSYIAFL
jgi:hypothetical protein